MSNHRTKRRAARPIKDEVAELDPWAGGIDIQRQWGRGGGMQVPDGMVRHTVNRNKSGSLNIEFVIPLAVHSKLGWARHDRISVRYIEGRAAYVLTLSDGHGAYTLGKGTKRQSSLSLQVTGYEGQCFSELGKTDCDAEVDERRNRIIVLIPDMDD